MTTNIIYSDRKTLCIKIERDGAVTVRAPRGTGQYEIEQFILRHEKWIESHREKALAKFKLQEQISDSELLRLQRAAEQYIPRRAAFYASVMGVEFTGIKITRAKTRFGSCSAKNSLCFSLYLMCYPQKAADAVIVHELAHIRHKNHSSAFYREIEKVMPDYKERKFLLKNGIL